MRCRECPRLVSFRESVAPRRSFADDLYWRRPVPGFGDVNGRLLVLGLAPAAHGGNRTGRVFTGDSSGRFLVRALHQAGFANQDISESRLDGLVYSDCYLTAAVKCSPPGDKPTASEFRNCSKYLEAELHLLRNLKSVLVLGSMAFRAYLDHLERGGTTTRGLKFAHGEKYEFKTGPKLYVSYHPSPRNTNTGKLSDKMLLSILGRIREDIEGESRI